MALLTPGITVKALLESSKVSKTSYLSLHITFDLLLDLDPQYNLRFPFWVREILKTCSRVLKETLRVLLEPQNHYRPSFGPSKGLLRLSIWP